MLILAEFWASKAELQKAVSEPLTCGRHIYAAAINLGLCAMAYNARQHTLAKILLGNADEQKITLSCPKDRSLKLTPVASTEFILVDFFNMRRLFISQGSELLFTGSLGK